ncbi:hypothetical protein [Pseudarthrobacter sp. BIM B-2242]|uniref:DUF6998 domain-containing protein n=1 Tax=Pseudarthrobacter sp. BIM B-2242 TaxID=2772401 RepID=UPI00168AA11A|nr:hypothetical protein [Pseudarthrobacter sp. BIM B-2242]QOD05800.1 hypothetical protein IDT60_22665 [Pseudarthrobacter sp. BIM B-2242]
MSEPILPALSGLSVHDLLRVPHEVLEELRRRGIIRGRNVTGDIGEYLAAAMYNVERAAPGTPGYDVADASGLRIQVKTRAFSTNPSIRRYRGLEGGGFDAVLFLALDPVTFEPFRAREVSAARIKELMSVHPGGLKYPHIKDEGVDMLELARSAYRLL